jgi:hypothetical protein
MKKRERAERKTEREREREREGGREGGKETKNPPFDSNVPVPA